MYSASRPTQTERRAPEPSGGKRHKSWILDPFAGGTVFKPAVSDAKAACLKLRELIDCIDVALRVKPGDPIHFEVRGRLAALTQPDPGIVSVGALVPRGGLPLLKKFKCLFAKWDLDGTIESHSVFFTRSHRDQFRLGTDLLPELMSEWIGAALRRSGAARDDPAPNQSLL